jgi:hypothetical protein
MGKDIHEYLKINAFRCQKYECINKLKYQTRLSEESVRTLRQLSSPLTRHSL